MGRSGKDMIKTIKKSFALAGSWYTIPIFIIIFNLFFNAPSIFLDGEASETVAINLPFFGLMMMAVFTLIGYSNMFITAVTYGQTRANGFKLVTLSNLLFFSIVVVSEIVANVIQVVLSTIRGAKVEFLFDLSLRNISLFLVGSVFLLALCSLINLLAVKYKWLFGILLASIVGALFSIGFFIGIRISSGELELPAWLKSGDFDFILNSPLLYAAIILITLLCYYLQWQVAKKQSFDK